MKILIFTKNWLGDVLFQLPAIEAIRKKYPAAEIVCASPQRCHEILLAHPGVNRVLPFDEKNKQRGVRAKFEFLKVLKQEAFDLTFVFHRSSTRSLLALLAGIKQRIGYRYHRGFLLTHSIEAPKEALHHVDFYTPLLKSFGLDVDEVPTYEFFFSEQSASNIDERLKQLNVEEGKFVCFHLGANWEPKRWPIHHFQELAEGISKEYNLPIFLTGGPGDQTLADQFLEKKGQAQVHSLVGALSLEELGALFASAAWIVSGDSGPMHIASGVGARTVVLFGPTDPRLTGPRGKGESIILDYVPDGFTIPWLGKDFPEEGWLEKITPTQVIDAIKKEAWTDKQLAAPAAAKKILFVTLSNIGDVILTTPVMMALLQKYPGAVFDVVTSPKAQGIFKDCPLVDDLILYDKKKSGAKKEILKKLFGRRYDLVVDLRNSAIPFLVCAKKRSPVFRKFKSLSMRKRHLEVLQSMGLETVATKSFPFFGDTELEEAKSLLGDAFSQKNIFIAPIAASDTKTWPLDKYSQLIARLLEQTSAQIFLLGDGNSREPMESLTSLNPARVINLGGKTDLRSLAAVLTTADLLVTNDSAIMHLGFEMGKKVVALFGPTHHLKYGHEGDNFYLVRADSDCSPCEKAQCLYDRQHCFEDLSVENAWTACQKALHLTSPEPVSL